MNGAAGHRRAFRRRVSPLLCWLGTLLSVAALLCVSRDAHAYAWMIRHGYAKCSSCHVDPSGGELLTNFGRVQSDVLMSQQWSDDSEPADFAKFLGGVNEPDWLRLGGSVRVMTLLYRDGRDPILFPMQGDVYGQARMDRFIVGGSIGVARIPEGGGAKHAAAAQLTTNTSDFNLLSRSHYIGYQPDDEWTLRGGRLNLPFGLRVPEHTMWIREETRTDRESDQQHGIAAAYSGGRIRGELMFSFGNFQVNPDRYRERGYAGFLEVMVTPNIAVGASSLMLRADDDRNDPQDVELFRTAHGPMVRATIFKPLVVMAEMDLLTSSRSDVGYAGVVQLDYEPIQGLHLQGLGEVRDAGKPNGDAEGRLGKGSAQWGGWLGFAWFPVSHVDVRLDVVIRENEPFTFQSQAHIYF